MSTVMTMTPHHPHHQPWQDLPEGFADHLNLEAQLSEPVRNAALDCASLALDSPPSRIVDVGSGTGADTVALAQRFPTAQVHALDISTELLGRVDSAAAAAEVSDRVETHCADLDQTWEAEIPPGADLAWASLSLHHVSDPASALRNVYDALRPGGVLALTELTGEVHFEPQDLGTGSTSLQERLTTALSDEHRVSTEWSELLAQAGFTAVQHHSHQLTVRADTTGGAQYLMRQLQAQRRRLAEELTGSERAAFDEVIKAVQERTSRISLHSGRSVWTAARPQAKADVAVLGGGSAGLAAAIALGRSRRNVVVVDAGQPRNAPAAGAHNVLGHEGIPPQELIARGRAEAEGYGVRILNGEVTGVSGGIDDFTVTVSGGTGGVRARRLILATGLVDDLPDIPGVAAGWGHSVLHCAFCHGWEIRDQRIAILARGEVSVHHALLFSQLSDHVTVFLHDAGDPTPEQQEQLEALNVTVVRPRVARLVLDGRQVTAVETEDGRSFETGAVVVVPRFNARTEQYESLGGTAEATPFGIQIPADPRGMTQVPGVWAAGNATQLMAMVVTAAASGVTAGTAVHADLASADLSRTVEVRRAEEGA